MSSAKNLTSWARHFLQPTNAGHRQYEVYGTYNSTLGGGDGDLVKVTYADGSFDAYRYDSTFHHVTQTSNALREVSTNTYDASTGDLLTSTDARGSTTTNVWSNGLLVSSTDPRGITTYNWYDADRRLAETTDAWGPRPSSCTTMPAIPRRRSTPTCGRPERPTTPTTIWCRPPTPMAVSAMRPTTPMAW
jgi:YD repeat-containing protein